MILRTPWVLMYKKGNNIWVPSINVMLDFNYTPPVVLPLNQPIYGAGSVMVLHQAPMADYYFIPIEPKD